MAKQKQIFCWSGRVAPADAVEPASASVPEPADSEEPDPIDERNIAKVVPIGQGRFGVIWNGRLRLEKYPNEPFAYLALTALRRNAHAIDTDAHLALAISSARRPRLRPPI